MCNKSHAYNKWMLQYLGTLPLRRKWDGDHRRTKKIRLCHLIRFTVMSSILHGSEDNLYACSWARLEGKIVFFDFTILWMKERGRKGEKERKLNQSCSLISRTITINLTQIVILIGVFYINIGRHAFICHQFITDTHATHSRSCSFNRTHRNFTFE